MMSKLRRKALDRAVCSLLAGMTPMVSLAAATQPAMPDVADVPKGPYCDNAGCMDNGALLFELRTRAYDDPRSGAVAEERDSQVLQPDRRVDVGLQLPGQASVHGHSMIDLPAGGVVWASEDPALGQRSLAISAASVVGFADGKLISPLMLQVRSNYPAFIQRFEVAFYREQDTDLVRPLATVAMPVAAVSRIDWQGGLAESGLALRVGDSIRYVLRAIGHDGQIDETFAQSVQLVTPDEAKQSQRRLRDQLQAGEGVLVDEAQALEKALLDAVFASNDLRRSNIVIRGSKVRLEGRDIAAGQTLYINDDSYPVDMERKFAAEFLMPVGSHRFDVRVGEGDNATSQALQVDVSGKYLFGVGLADVSVSRHSVGGSAAMLEVAGVRADESITRARLAFYGKARMDGRYLVTAQADTTDRELDRLFSGFTDTTPEDLFRRLDPDLYYPVYGDDSTTVRDVDSMGRLYLRMDWDQNSALWGNYNASITGTEFAQYQRALYGAALQWRAPAANAWGDAATTLQVFGAQPDAVQGRSEFIGTGGSLYYLRHTDLLPGSDVVSLQVRDATTGRIEGQQTLTRGVDYEIDELQGRILLTVPLAQITRRNVPTLSRDTPLDGFEQRLLVDYAWVPTLLDDSSATLGARGKHWLGDHLAIGASHVREGRAGEDYQLDGVDVTLQAGQGTWLRAELARTESFGVPVHQSHNGGLDFVLGNRLDANREGEARAVEARVNLQELGWTDQSWAVSAWWRDREAGYSTSLYDSNEDVRETGVEVQGQINERWQLSARASQRRVGQQTLDQSFLSLGWNRSESSTLAAELRRVDERDAGGAGAGTLLTARWLQRLGHTAEIYAQGQLTIDDDNGQYAANDAVSIGGQWLLADRFNLTADATHGDRGTGYTAQAEYRLSPEHSLYGGYTYSTDTTSSTLLRPSATDDGWTMGQRWRLGPTVNVFNESQMLRSGQEAGLAHTFGLDFYPSAGWRSGFTLSRGDLETSAGGQIDRKAISVNLGRTDPRTDWSSKLEWRRDTGAEDREQWVSSNRLTHRLNEDWRLAMRLNWSDTQDLRNPLADARFIEANTGLAWRPANSQRWALLSRYTYLYDLATTGQLGGAQVDQKSHVLAIEGIYKHNQRWEYAAKLARREGSVRMGRGQGEWLDSATTFGAIQARYDLRMEWHALAEYRVLDVDKGGRRAGALLALERDLGKNLRVGAGYNFGDFSDDLTDFDYDQRGWFLSLTGTY